MTDFDQKDNLGRQNVDGRVGENSLFGQGSSKVLEGEGRYQKRDGYRNGNVYRAKDGKANSYGRGRSSGWPAPLYQVQRGHMGQTRLVDAVPEQGLNRFEGLDKGKGKKVAESDISKEADVEFDENLELDEEALVVEEGELGAGDYEMEEQSGQTCDFKFHEANQHMSSKGMDDQLLTKVDGIELLSNKLFKCYVVIPTVKKTENKSSLALKGVNIRKRNLWLLVSPRKPNGNNVVISKQVNSAVQRRTGKVLEVKRKPEVVGQRILSTKKGMVALPKLPANT